MQSYSFNKRRRFGIIFQLRGKHSHAFARSVMAAGIAISHFLAANAGAAGDCTTSTDLFTNPFNKKSAHHRPIGVNAEYAGDTHSSTLTWLNNTHRTIAINVGSPWGISVAATEASDPFYTIRAVRLDCGKVDGFPKSIRLPREGFPTPVIVKNGCTDGVVVVYDRDSQIPHQIRQYNWNNGSPLGGQYKTWDMSGLGHGTRPGDRVGTSASGVAALFGLLRGDEINDGTQKVEHALQIALPRKPGDCAMMLSRQVVLPAVAGDSSMNTGSNNTGNIPYGALMALLPPSRGGPDLNALGLTTRGQRLAEAVRHYGIYVVDGSECLSMRADQYVQNTSELKSTLTKIYPYIRMVLNNDVLGSPTAGGGDPRAPNCAFDAG